MILEGEVGVEHGCRPVYQTFTLRQIACGKEQATWELDLVRHLKALNLFSSFARQEIEKDVEEQIQQEANCQPRAS